MPLSGHSFLMVDVLLLRTGRWIRDTIMSSMSSITMKQKNKESSSDEKSNNTKNKKKKKTRNIHDTHSMV